MLLSPPRMLSELAQTAQETFAFRLGRLGSPQLAPELKVLGDASTLVTAICPAEAIEPGCLTFATDQKYLDQVEASEAGAVIVPPNLASTVKPSIQTPEPRVVFSILLELTMELSRPVQGDPGGATFKDRSRVEIGKNSVIGPLCYIGQDVRIGEDCLIHPHAYIDDGVCLGDGCIIYPQVTLLRHTKLGNRVIIHPGAVIGDEGFNYNQMVDLDHNRLLHIKNAHAGGVDIGDDVEIGAGVCIDRGLAVDTVIGSGTKIDNLVHLAHNVQVGRDCIILAQVGVAGSSRFGDRVFILGQAGISNGVTVGDDAILMAKSGISTNIPSAGSSGPADLLITPTRNGKSRLCPGENCRACVSFGGY